MPRPFHHVAFVLSGWGLPSAGQQLLDRFLMGYPDRGTFRRPTARVSAFVAEGDDEAARALRTRQRDYGLILPDTLKAGVVEADAAVVSWGALDHEAHDPLLRHVLEELPLGASCFVAGCLGSSLDAAREAAHLAQARSIRLLAGSCLNVTWRLPQWELPPDRRIDQALLVAPGPFPAAEYQALESLLPILRNRAGGEAGVRSLTRLEGNDLWHAGEKGRWSWDLAAAAISRSDSPQGDPVRDGRTQDLVGLGLVRALAKEPRGWLLDHGDGLRTALLMLEGVIGDIDVAVRVRRSEIWSAQVYQPPRPQQQHYSVLAGKMEQFFLGDPAPWPLGQPLLVAGLIHEMRRLRSQSTHIAVTPQLER